jgi:hypothetical protein
MKVRFVRTGGLAAAMRREYTADSAAMPPEDARELSRLIEAADFFQLPGSGPRPQGMRDAFQYKVSVEIDGREHTVDWPESAVPEKARDLIRWLDRRAGPQGR